MSSLADANIKFAHSNIYNDIFKAEVSKDVYFFAVHEVHLYIYISAVHLSLSLNKR